LLKSSVGLQDAKFKLIRYEASLDFLYGG